MFDIARRITIVNRDHIGRPVVIHEKVRRKRKRSKSLKPLEQIERRVLRANGIFVNELVRLHDRSTAKRKDGWLYDAPANLLRAGSKYYRRLLRP